MTVSHARGKIIRLVALPLLTIFIIIFLPTILSAAGKVTIKEIKHQSFKEYTRITIHLSGSVEFTMKHLSNPERLYFDIKNTALTKKIKPSINVGDGIIKAVRTKQFSKDTVRVVFDLDKAVDFKASLTNKKSPMLVVDIYASKPLPKEPDTSSQSLEKKPDVTTPKKEPETITPPTKTPEIPKPDTQPQAEQKHPDVSTQIPTKLETIIKKEPVTIKPEITIKYGKATIKNILYKSFKNHTQVIINLTGPIEFSKNRISRPERLFFDLKNTTLPKKIKANFTIGDGILKSARSRQYSKDIVRVVLDIEKAEDFDVSLIDKKNPRLVIDVYAVKIKKPVITTPTPASEPLKKPDITPPLQKEPETSLPPPTKPETPIMKKEDVASLLSSGEKHVESGEHEKALLDFKKAAELSPGKAEIYVFIGRSLFKMGKKDEALEAYKIAVERDPNSADAYNGLGYTYYAMGKSSSAIDAFLTAIKLNPDHDDARAGLGYTYLTIGDTNAAIEQYRILKGLESNKAEDLFHLIFKVQNKKQTKILK